MAIDYDRVNWQDNLNTPLGQRNLNKMDKGIKDVTNYLNKSNTYTLLSGSWIGTGSSTYPYVNIISAPGVYTSDDHPIAQVWGVGEIESDDEIAGISYISKVIVGPTGVKVYAIQRPPSNLRLVLKE